MLRDRPNECVTEDASLFIWKKIICALAHIHALSFMHRDLHSGNILLTLEAASGKQLFPGQVKHVKVADFGKATQINTRTSKKPPVYTAVTAVAEVTAPEVLFRRGMTWSSDMQQRKRSAGGSIKTTGSEPRPASSPRYCCYNEKIDIWASGILLLRMVRGFVYKTRCPDDVPGEMVQVFGKIPASLRWSVPEAWQCSNSADQPRGQALLQKQFTKRDLMWQQDVTAAATCLEYDPDKRLDARCMGANLQRA